MKSVSEILNTFLNQSLTGDLKTAHFPKEFSDLNMKTSFGQGVPARVSWIAFTSPEMAVSNGYYPVYLYYKSLNVLVLSYGISETVEHADTWPLEITNSKPTIKSYLDGDIPRYGASFVYKAYKIEVENDNAVFADYESGDEVTSTFVESDLENLLSYYKEQVSIEVRDESSPVNQSLFYMEKQLEDFIIHNWDNTDFAKEYELIYEEGELVSQQFRTDIGPIDILAKSKRDGHHLVIELKKGQTSDDTVGQIARYMGWIKEHKSDTNVKGVIVAGAFDAKLRYAMELINNVDVFIYKLDFSLEEFKK